MAGSFRSTKGESLGAENKKVKDLVIPWEEIPPMPHRLGLVMKRPVITE